MKHNTRKQFTKARNKAIAQLRRKGITTNPTEREIAVQTLFGGLKTARE